MTPPPNAEEAEAKRRAFAVRFPTFESYFREVSEELEYPEYLGPILEAVQKTQKGRVRALISCPPQHGKTEMIKHCLGWLMAIESRRHAYVSYNADRGEEISLEVQWLVDRIEMARSGPRHQWRTPWGSALRSTGIGGGLTGYPIDGVCFVDDAFKDWEEANSPVMRDRVYNWFRSVAGTRRHLKTSYIVVGTRWHEDDLIGRLLKAGGWTHVNLPAISDEGKALCETRFPLPLLNEIRADIGPLFWSALYEGVPRDDEQRLFKPFEIYDELPKSLRYGIGIDLAYDLDHSRDYSAIVVIGCDVATGDAYLVKAWRKQCRVDPFLDELKRVMDEYPGARTLFHAAATETSTADMMRVLGLRVEWSPVGRHGKYARAQRYAGRVNQDRVKRPRELTPTMHELVTEHAAFTGRDDAHDDLVDAAVAAFDACSIRSDNRIRVLGSSDFPSWQPTR